MGDNDMMTPSRNEAKMENFSAGSSKVLALPAPVDARMPNKGRDFRITPNKRSMNKEQIQQRIYSQDEEINVKLKKNLIIQILLKI
jgi:tRNA U54 and U55 pseudouridine synthase Pus10